MQKRIIGILCYALLGYIALLILVGTVALLSGNSYMRAFEITSMVYGAIVAVIVFCGSIAFTGVWIQEKFFDD